MVSFEIHCLLTTGFLLYNFFRFSDKRYQNYHGISICLRNDQQKIYEILIEQSNNLLIILFEIVNNKS